MEPYWWQIWKIWRWKFFACFFFFFRWLWRLFREVKNFFLESSLLVVNRIMEIRIYEFSRRYVIVRMEFNTWRVLENVKKLGRVFDEVERRNVFSAERDSVFVWLLVFYNWCYVLKFVRRGFKVDWVKQVIKSYIIAKILWRILLSRMEQDNTYYFIFLQ